MTTDDVKIRSAVRELIEGAPPAPPFPTGRPLRSPRGSRAVLALATAAAVVVAGAGVVVLVNRRPNKSSDRLSSSPATTAAPGVPSIQSVPRSGRQLQDVWFVDAVHGWALETRCTTAARCPLLVTSSQDGGATWTDRGTVTTLDPSSSAFRVRVSTLADGYAFGGSVRGSDPGHDGGLWATHDGARTWRKLPINGVIRELLPGPRVDEVITGSCPPMNSCSHQFQVSEDHGRSWRVRADMPRAPNDVYAVRHGASVWVYATSLEARPNGSKFLSTSDDGVHWSIRAAPCTSWSAGLSVTSSGAVWLVCGSVPGAGEQGKQVFRSDDDGKHWRLMESNFTDTKRIGSMTMSGYVQSVAAVSGSRAFLATDRGTLLETTDGGTSWSGVRDFPYGESFFTGFVFVDGRHGWVGAHVPASDYVYRIYRTSDGGRSWTSSDLS